MRKVTAMLALILAAGVSLGSAGNMENLRDSSPDISKITISDLQQGGIDININGVHTGIPLPEQIGNPLAGRQGRGAGYYPPVPYPNSSQRQFSFNSGGFAFGSDAEKSMNNAVASLKIAGYPILEKHRNFNSYTLSFLAPDYARIEQYQSGAYYPVASVAKRAADEAVAAFESQGMAVLEKRVEWTSFTVGYLTKPYAGQIKDFSFNSGKFAFGSDAEKSMNNAVASLKIAGHPILEKHRDLNSYTLNFLAPDYARIEQYKSGAYPFAHEAKRAADEAAAAFEAQGIAVLEKRVDRTSFAISYLNPG